MISPKSIVFVILVLIMIISPIFFIQAVVVLWNTYAYRITGNIPLTQVPAFTELPVLFSSIIEANSEIKPGDTFTMTIRGIGERNISKPTKIVFAIKSQDAFFVKSIKPQQVIIDIDAQDGYVLPAIDIVITTNRINNPPTYLFIEVIETISVSATEKPITSNTYFSTFVDSSPFPLKVVIQALISVIVFLLSAFGTKVTSN